MAANNYDHFKKYIREIPDFPKPGILFSDVTPLLQNAQAFKGITDALAEHYRGQGITHVAAIEARGYLFGAPLALALNAGFIVIRKPGKLPSETIAKDYSLEYGHNTIEIHKDACGKGDKVLLIDDLIATGGSAQAALQLIEELGAEPVGAGFIIELEALKGRDLLSPKYEVFSLLKY